MTDKKLAEDEYTDQIFSMFKKKPAIGTKNTNNLQNEKKTNYSNLLKLQFFENL